MKKIVLIATILVLCFSTIILGGDIPEGLMQGEHKALFIGKISINEDRYNVIPSVIMMGEINEAEIYVRRFEKYYGTSDKPREGDIIIAVLLDDNVIDESWVFKCTSDDYKTLKLISEPYNMVQRYEEYINEGKYFEAQKKIDESKEVSAITDTTIREQAAPAIQTTEEIETKPNNKLMITLLVLLIGGVGALVLVKIKKKKEPLV